jgi:hypothetical protein
MEWYVTLIALIAGIICFLIYAASAIATLCAKRQQAASDLASTAKSMVAAAQPKATVEEYSKLLDAASKLTDSLSKAGPALVSLVGAILFLLIAAVSSGAFKNSGLSGSTSQTPPAASGARTGT